MWIETFETWTYDEKPLDVQIFIVKALETNDFIQSNHANHFISVYSEINVHGNVSTEIG